MKLSKTQLCQIGRSGLFLLRLLGSLVKTGLSSTKNALQPVA